MRRVLFTEAARADLAEAVDWYHVHAAQMVPEFRESAVARIAANPKQFPAGPYQTRRALDGRGLLCRCGLSHETRSDDMAASYGVNDSCNSGNPANP